MTGRFSEHRILVTGASGFLGKQFSENLIWEGAEVMGIDRRSPGPGPDNEPKTVRPQRFVQGELKDVFDETAEFLASVPVAQRGVFHLAGLADAHQCQCHPDFAFASHIETTFSVLEMCRRIGGATLFYPSTGLVYGQSCQKPVVENSPVIDDSGSVYVSMKLSAESMIRLYARHYGVGGIIGRLANIYGPGMGDNTIIGRILSQVREKKRIRVREMTSVRDFIYSEDVVDAALALFSKPITESVLIVNISTGIGMRLETLVTEASRLFQTEYDPPEECQTTKNDPSHLVLSNEKLKKLTGWTPKTILTEGLIKSLKDSI